MVFTNVRKISDLRGIDRGYYYVRFVLPPLYSSDKSPAGIPPRSGIPAGLLVHRSRRAGCRLDDELPQACSAEADVPKSLLTETNGDLRLVQVEVTKEFAELRIECFARVTALEA